MEDLAVHGWLAIHLAIVVLPIVNVVLSPHWDQPAKAGWVVAILSFNLFAYGVFLLMTANKVNRREAEVAREPAQTVEGLSTVFVVGRWISNVGRKLALGIAIGILGWVLIHLADSDWMRQSFWPFYYLLLFMYWLPVEIGGQILMALGRRTRPKPKPGP